MLARTEPACLVIADIAGYGGYLAGVELDHAQDILADLIDTVVASLRPSFKLANLEGDAAFVWVPTATVYGPALSRTPSRAATSRSSVAPATAARRRRASATPAAGSRTWT